MGPEHSPVIFFEESPANRADGVHFGASKRILINVLTEIIPKAKYGDIFEVPSSFEGKSR